VDPPAVAVDLAARARPPITGSARPPVHIETLLLTLALIWVGAEVFGELAERFRQPAVLGELLAGVVLGVGGLGLVDPRAEIVHLLAEIGVVILLFEIGLEMRLVDLLRVGGASSVVAVVGVVLPLAAGYLAGVAIGAEPVVALFLGATLTATSVGVTARVLRDLGRLDSTEARVILGAAVIDDVLGLVLLTLVTGVVAGGEVTAGTAVRVIAVAVVFLAGALLLGRILVPPGLRIVVRLRSQNALVPTALTLAFLLSVLAARAGSATIVGAFAAGLILAETERRHDIGRDLRSVAHFFVPIFFVVVGAQVDLRHFNPFAPGGGTLLLGVLGLSVLAVLTKWAAGFAPFWIRARKNAIGLGMVPRGEVGLVFAQVGRSSGLLSPEHFAAIVLIVMITTFLAPILLRASLPPRVAASERRGGAVEDLVAGDR
jgi:Kef-type K+ transport system membrane component KefB